MNGNYDRVIYSVFTQQINDHFDKNTCVHLTMTLFPFDVCPLFPYVSHFSHELFVTDNGRNRYIGTCVSRRSRLETKGPSVAGVDDYFR